MQLDTASQTVTFGIEIESFVNTARANAIGLVRGYYHRGTDLAQYGFPGWKAESDCSLSTSLATHTPVEFVSPVLRGSEGMATVQRFCGWLASLDARVNHTCGMHVHVGAESGSGSREFGVTMDWVVRLANLTSHVEEGLYAATGTTSRQNSYYCAPVKRGLGNAVKSAAAASDAYSKRYTLQNTARYHALNLTNLRDGSGKYTVEFRFQAGTTSFVKIQATIGLAVGLAVRARSSKFGWQDTAREPRPSYATVGKGTEALDYLLRRIGWASTTKIPALGFIPTSTETADAEFATARKELRRLAAKYDGRLATAEVA